MKHSEQNKMHVLKEKFMTVRDWIMDHNKIVMPLVLIVCVLITVVAAVNANQKEALQKEAQQAAMAVASEETTTSIQGLETPVFELEENAHPEINNLVKTYYDAQASGDMETISSLNTYLNDIEKIRVQELSKYIDSYPEINVYTKPGLTENTYVAYVCSEVQFSDVDVPLPGMQTYYIGMNGDGNYFINDGTYDESIQAYIKKITLQDDVVDLNNKIVVEYNELLAEDEELSEFIAYLKEKINEDVGEILAEVEQPAQEENPADTENADAETSADTAQNVVKTVRTTDVVNIRNLTVRKRTKSIKRRSDRNLHCLKNVETAGARSNITVVKLLSRAIIWKWLTRRLLRQPEQNSARRNLQSRQLLLMKMRMRAQAEPLR